MCVLTWLTCGLSQRKAFRTLTIVNVVCDSWWSFELVDQKFLALIDCWRNRKCSKGSCHNLKDLLVRPRLTPHTRHPPSGLQALHHGDCVEREMHLSVIPRFCRRNEKNFSENDHSGKSIALTKYDNTKRDKERGDTRKKKRKDKHEIALTCMYVATPVCFGVYHQNVSENQNYGLHTNRLNADYSSRTHTRTRSLLFSLLCCSPCYFDVLSRNLNPTGLFRISLPAFMMFTVQSFLHSKCSNNV